MNIIILNLTNPTQVKFQNSKNNNILMITTIKQIHHNKKPIMKIFLKSHLLAQISTNCQHFKISKQQMKETKVSIKKIFKPHPKIEYLIAVKA